MQQSICSVWCEYCICPTIHDVAGPLVVKVIVVVQLRHEGKDSFLFETVGGKGEGGPVVMKCNPYSRMARIEICMSFPRGRSRFAPAQL